MLKFGDAPTKSSTFELLATVKAVTEFQKSDIVLGHRVDQVPCGSELTQSELVMVFIVQDVYEGGQEGVKVLMPASTIST